MFSMTALMYERTRDLDAPEWEHREEPVPRDRAGWLGALRLRLATVRSRSVTRGRVVQQFPAAALFFGRRT